MPWSDWHDGYPFSGDATVGAVGGFIAYKTVPASSSPMVEWAQRAVSAVLAGDVDTLISGGAGGDIFVTFAGRERAEFQLIAGQRIGEWVAAPPSTLPPAMAGLTEGVDYGPDPADGGLFEYETPNGTASNWTVAFSPSHRTNYGLSESIDVVWDVLQLDSMPPAVPEVDLTTTVADGTVPRWRYWIPSSVGGYWGVRLGA
jgi:hypothetical protein